MTFELREEHLDIMRHALGIQKRNGRWSIGGWRNRYVLFDNSDNTKECETLLEHGYMVKSKLDSTIYGNSFTYQVTEKGILELQRRNFKIVRSKI